MNKVGKEERKGASVGRCKGRGWGRRCANMHAHKRGRGRKYIGAHAQKKDKGQQQRVTV